MVDEPVIRLNRIFIHPDPSLKHAHPDSREGVPDAVGRSSDRQRSCKVELNAEPRLVWDNGDHRRESIIGKKKFV